VALVQDYPRFHQNKTNLLLHIVMVPLFVVGVLYALSSAMQGHWLAASSKAQATRESQTRRCLSMAPVTS